MRGLDQAVYGRIDLRGRKLAPVGASDCGLRGGRSCEHRQGERWDEHRSMHAEISLNAETLTLRQKFRCAQCSVTSERCPTAILS